MPTQEAILTVILVAIVANLIVAVGLLVGPRFRRRIDHDESAEIHQHVFLRAQTVGGPGDPGDQPAATGGGGQESAIGNGLSRLERSDEPEAAMAFAADPTIAMAAASGGDSGESGAGDSGEPGDPDPAEAALTDATTGLDSPATWAKRLTEENARVQRYGRAATVVLVELAGVDRLAERLGSAAADRLIPPIATTMRRHARSADSLARLGPSRFAALMPDTDEIKAINYIERIRSACDVWLEAGAVSLRLSIGWAEINANQTVDPAVQVAERRLNEERARFRARDVVDFDPDRNLGISQMRAAPAN
jgi:diguanylate cyclase (GGDEF)-like protein